MPSVFRNVDPRELRVPRSRLGADPLKLQRQISLFGSSSAGMPPPVVYQGTDGVLLLYNGVTRATCIVKCALRRLIRNEVTRKMRTGHASKPKIGHRLP